MSFADGDLSRDGFLDGRLTILQPKRGYRAATDPVFLAAAVPAVAGQSVLELGCGAGVASLCLAARVPGLRLSAVELQADYADLAHRNAAENGVDLQVACGDLRDMPAALRTRSFDHVFFNPPYFTGGTAPDDPGRSVAHMQDAALADWVEVALRRLHPGGHITVIHLAEALPELMAALSETCGGITVLPLAARQGRAAKRVIVQARKGARAPARLLAPFVIHEGSEHGADSSDFTTEAQDILRHGAPLLMS